MVVLGFYGSGIVNFLDILPVCTFLLLYSKKECVSFVDKLSEFRNLRVDFFGEGVDYEDTLALRNTLGPGECVYHQTALFINMIKGRAVYHFGMNIINSEPFQLFVRMNIWHKLNSVILKEGCKRYEI